MPKSACFDVLGTCFDFQAAIDTIEARLGPKLRTASTSPTSLFFTWFYSAQRDFTYTSLADHYIPITRILRLTFRRTCAILNLPAHEITDEDIEIIMTHGMQALSARPGLKKCYDGLRAAGWEVYGVTNGGKEASLRYYEAAGVEIDGDHLLSCDEIRVAKPDGRVYENANGWLTSRGLGEERWFVAAHAWDLMAARKAGFKTAYLDFEEHDPVTEVFGEFDLYAKDMGELLEKLRGL